MKINYKYWLCQLLGWGGWTLVNVFFVYLFANDMYMKPQEKRNVFLAALFIEYCWSILGTHLLRLTLKKIQWMKLPTKKVIMLFIAGVSLTGIIVYYGSRATAIVINKSIIEYEKKEDLNKAITREKQLNLAGTDYYLLATTVP